MYDCRADADALFHQYRVRLDGVYDLQVALVKTKLNMCQNLPGIAVCISRCCGDTSPEAESFKLSKEKGAGVIHSDIFRHFSRHLISSFQISFHLSGEAPSKCGDSVRCRPSC
jgi:hypothetical protein